MSWLLGGLNFQIEHHLFPRICHIHYPAISELVEQTCRDFGIRYTEHRSFWAGMASHFRWLRRMGMPDGADAGLGPGCFSPADALTGAVRSVGETGLPGQ